MTDQEEWQIVQRDIEQELAFSSADRREEAWFMALAARINELVIQDFHKLVSMLYRLDVNETRLREELNKQSGSEGAGVTDAGMIIARLMMERQLQKLKSRKEFRRDEKIDEDEKW